MDLTVSTSMTGATSFEGVQVLSTQQVGSFCSWLKHQLGPLTLDCKLSSSLAASLCKRRSNEPARISRELPSTKLLEAQNRVYNALHFGNSQCILPVFWLAGDLACSSRLGENFPGHKPTLMRQPNSTKSGQSRPPRPSLIPPARWPKLTCSTVVRSQRVTDSLHTSDS